MANVKKNTQGFSLNVRTRPRELHTKPELSPTRRLGRTGNGMSWGDSRWVESCEKPNEENVPEEESGQTMLGKCSHARKKI